MEDILDSLGMDHRDEEQLELDQVRDVVVERHNTVNSLFDSQDQV